MNSERGARTARTKNEEERLTERWTSPGCVLTTAHPLPMRGGRGRKREELLVNLKCQK